MCRFLAGCFLMAGLWAAEPPEARIGNGQIEVAFHLPDPANGAYRGARFDWSGVVKSLTYKGHEYFGKWNDIADPQHHDAISGPVEEFLSGDETLGYGQAPVGGNFVRIGVGALRKDKDEKFARFGRYQVVDPGEWTVSAGKDRIRFIHVLRDASSGYAYRYEKIIRLEPRGSVMWIEHRLRNLGRKAIDTSTYNHNFLVIDGEPTGPNMSVDFGFQASPKSKLEPLAKLDGRRLAYNSELQTGQTVMSEMTGFSEKTSDYHFSVENRKTGAGVRINGDRPLEKVIFWSIRRVLCPEPYVRLRVAPGKTTTWAIRYEFYELAKGK